MDYGIAGIIGADSWKTVKRAEELGFSHAWFYDSPLYAADIFVAMGAAAMKTKRIRLGLGVAVPSVRIAPTLANGLATLTKLAPGRIDFGLGTGHTARSLFGMPAIRLAEMREYLRIVGELLAGNIVDYEFEGAPRKIKLMHPWPDLVDSKDPIDWHLSAMGPKSRALGAELGLGWMNYMSGVPQALADLEDMLAKWKAAGRDPDTCYTTGFTMGCVLGDTEPDDSPRALVQAGPHVATVLQHLIKVDQQIELGMLGSTDLNQAAAEYQKIYNAYQPPDTRYIQFYRGELQWLLPEEQHLITGDLIREMTFTGSVDELRERIRSLADAGYRQLTIQLVVGHDDALDDWARVIEGV